MEGKDYCTLVTCTPYGVNSHRLLVRGHRVSNDENAGNIRVTADAMQIDPTIVAPVSAVPLLLIMIVAVMIKTRRKKEKNKEDGSVRIRKNSISIVLSVLLICMTFYTACTTAYAQDMPDLSHSGSISINLRYGDEPVSGGSLVCYSAGDVEKNNESYGFKLNADFQTVEFP